MTHIEGGRITYGITNLSQLAIDSTRDWGGYGIQNIAEPTALTDAARLKEARDKSMLWGLLLG